ncbi:outer membrane protein transport protein [Vibrio hannami]|uniref:OmpP1/FadL family transporter n=1 Tax=Vibrio hannami TaxID=2717094 RepID=UPI002410637E|nr:outer membrane protein transport protein [Vibrio hannami]MDG3086182.1 outer membrane protein transport protein [Vibrio hannami]
MKTPLLKLSAISLALFTAHTYAAATLVSEMSHLNVGTAGAGSAVLSESASAAFANPAAMASFEEQAVTLNLATMALDVTYEDYRNDTRSSGNAGGIQPYGSLYYVAPVSEKAAFGMAFTSTGGSSLEYDPGYAGYVGLKDVSLTLVQVNPSVGYQLTENLNVGAGLQAEYANLEQSFLGSTANLKGDSVALGYNVGATYKLNDSNELGLSYRSKLEHNLDGQVRFAESYDSSVNLVNAARLELSGLHQINDPLSLVWSVGQEYWSENEATTIQSGDISIDKSREFDDVWFASAGMRFDVSNNLRLEAGVGYVSSPQDDPDMQSTDLPVDEQRRYSAGATYRWNKSTSIKGYYSYVDYGNPVITSGLMYGEYHNHNQFFGIEINHSF